jgi:transposase
MQLNSFFVGVDVSKQSLDCWLAWQGVHLNIVNDSVAIGKWLGTLPDEAMIAMESTGRYHLLLAQLAHAAGKRVFVLNARDVFFYAKALGMRGKTDRSDCETIARYLAEHHHSLRPWLPASAEHREMEQLLRARTAIVTHRVALRQALHGLQAVHEGAQAVQERIDGLLAELDGRVQSLLRQDEQLRCASDRLQSITGIGAQGSALLATLLGRIPFANADALVAYSGLDPRPNDSGQRSGVRRLSKRGSPELRRQMYLAAFAASHSKALGPLYRAIKAKGFKPTEALVILARKLLRIVWAVWKSGKKFDPAVFSMDSNACKKT